jgi:hypothetical protein
MSSAQGIAIAGVGLNLAGVLLLFRYGMPFRVETKGAGFLMIEQTDYEAIRIERRYKLLGYLGLALIIVGSVFQALAVILV